MKIATREFALPPQMREGRGRERRGREREERESRERGESNAFAN